MQNYIYMNILRQTKTQFSVSCMVIKQVINLRCPYFNNSYSDIYILMLGIKDYLQS